MIQKDAVVDRILLDSQRQCNIALVLHQEPMLSLAEDWGSHLWFFSSVVFPVSPTHFITCCKLSFIVKNVLKIWASFWRHFGLHTTPVLSLVHSNPLFTPAVVDRAFSMWNEHGFVFMKYFFNLWHICLIQPVNSWLQSTFQSFLQIFMNQKLC